ncbi:MAG: uracil-DNA glycosylase [Hyphomicrobiales bacterium]|nr:uracil-DNA glycosylase [Hyphomicrobiales bacterium]
MDQPDVLAARIDDIYAAHVERLNVYVDELKATLDRQVPYFDPQDGGSNARVLVFLETPGPSQARVRFTSRDNPTGTARNLRRLFQNAKIDRSDTAIWNAVPWLLRPNGKRTRAPKQADIDEACAHLPDLFTLFPRLRAIILAGKTAAKLEPAIALIAPGIAIHRAAHPSPVYVNTRPHIFLDLLKMFESVATSLS